jgi:hypothetical protein
MEFIGRCAPPGSSSAHARGSERFGYGNVRVKVRVRPGKCAPRAPTVLRRRSNGIRVGSRFTVAFDAFCVVGRAAARSLPALV